jgi:hypothetical protein
MTTGRNDSMALRITERDRAAILSSLGAGVVPRVGLAHVQVGRKAEVGAMLGDLEKVEAGGAGVRFVVGRFGSGKTFFVHLMQTVALERKFVVAKADITTERRLSASGGQARSLFSELMKNVATRGKPDGGALTNLVERWVGSVADEITSAGGATETVATEIRKRLKPLEDLVSGYDFSHVLTQYYQGFSTGNDALRSSAVRWLRGEYSTKTEARGDLGVRSIIDDESFYDYLKLFAKFVRIAGHAGLIICLDELVVLSHRLNSRISRNNNYEAILRIINDCLQGNVEGLGFIFAATEECLSDKRRGLFSYEALATRLADNRFAGDGLVDMSGPVLRLAPLTPEDCFVLLHNIRHVQALGDPAHYLLPDQGIEAYLLSCRERLGAAYFQTPRETVKDFVGLLNVLAQNPQADYKALIGSIKTVQAQSQDEAVANPSPETDDGLSSFKL